MSHSLDAIFRPQSVAVIGASRDQTSIGREILNNLFDYEFNGPIYPVNPKAPVVHSLRAYRSVGDIPEPVDLAVVVVPRGAVLNVVDECGRKGVKGLVIITAGFKEVGEEGARLEVELKEKIDAYGMRMIGPNCMGVINTQPEVKLNASFAKAMALPGKVGFISQSGALGEAILSSARDLGLGIAMFASVGNKTDISGNDLLEYWENDPNVSLILLYLESFGNPRRFTKIARRITRSKPILAVKAGRTESGARAVGTHTGAMAGLDVAVETLLEQCGVVRAPTIEEMFVYAQAMVNQPLPKGNRIAVVTNGGGPGILAADALENLGLSVPPFSESSIQALREVLPPQATPGNPIDLIASARAIDARSVAISIVESLEGTDKPVVACFMGKVGQEEGLRILASAEIPVYRYPELAAEGLAAMVRCASLRSVEEGKEVRFESGAERAASVIEAARRQGRTDLTLLESMEVLDAYGIPCAPSRVVGSPADAIAFGIEAGYPIVLKVIAPELSHKTESGGVRVDLRNGDEAGIAFREMASRLDSFGPNARILAQKMLRGGKEVIFGITHDTHYGPLAMFGLGGIYVELLKDVTFKILPLKDREADDMIRSIRGFPLLSGFRGDKGVDLEILREMLLRISQLVTELQEIEALDVNPFIVTDSRGSSAAVDARIKLRA
jgi:acetyl coenzyme A synthetase (ADP forming)-like protein